MATLGQLLAGDQPVLVDFSAEWCGPCQMLAPVLKEIAREFSGRLTVITIDVDNPKNQTFAASQGVRSVPTLVLFHRGTPVWRATGYRPAAQLSRELQQQLSALEQAVQA
ncbi:MAG: hypothetical protein AA908_09150 [Chlorobi bacterium NICIL-2]|nr:MAG: hypothetical protein AA908_09150 [Chlorobi bacterium NICIL-2]